MGQLDKSGTLVDNCTACGGFWLDRGELERMIARRAKGSPSTEQLQASLEHLHGKAPAVRESPGFDCPRCRTGLGQISFQRGDAVVVVDKCPGCGGLWLDSGEMGLLFALVEEERGRRGSRWVVLAVLLLLGLGLAAFFLRPIVLGR